VDHPATQAWKRRCLVDAELAPPPWLTFVPVDFERDDLQRALSSAGFHRTSSAFFPWLGVVPYLTRDAIDDTLGYIASIPNSEVVFDYAESPEEFAEDMKAHTAARMAQLEKINERWVSRFDPAGIAAILRSHGFDGVEDTGFQQIVSRFGRDVQGLAAGQAGVRVVHAKH
jgi:methyltransferase (TIGR00027 family)